MTKMFAHVDGYVPGVIFNRTPGRPHRVWCSTTSSRPILIRLQHGFIGGATLGAEQQFLPIQISREALPPDVQRWGKPYKDHLRKWQNFGVVRIQPDTLSYTSNLLILTPLSGPERRWSPGASAYL